jgi:hypothetical protein
MQDDAVLLKVVLEPKLSWGQGLDGAPVRLVFQNVALGKTLDRNMFLPQIAVILRLMQFPLLAASVLDVVAANGTRSHWPPSWRFAVTQAEILETLPTATASVGTRATCGRRSPNSSQMSTTSF